MKKLKELYRKFRSLPGYQQDSGFFLLGVVLGALIF